MEAPGFGEHTGPDTQQRNEAVILNPEAKNKREHTYWWAESQEDPWLWHSHGSQGLIQVRGPATAWKRIATQALAPPLTKAHVVTWAVLFTFPGTLLPRQQKAASSPPYESKKC